MIDLTRPREADVRGCIEGLQKRRDGRRLAVRMNMDMTEADSPEARQEAEFLDLCARTMQRLANIVWGRK